jgi:putative peptide zinc metalloprotease protein
MASVYETLKQRLRLAAPSPDVWRHVRDSLNPALYRPVRDPLIEEHVVDDRRKPAYLVIKQPSVHAYLRLAQEERFLWEAMDGSRTVKDLVLAYFTQFGSLALGRIGGLVTHLRQSHFLRDKPQNVFAAILAQRSVSRLKRWGTALLRVLMGRLLVWRGIDRLIDRLYRAGGWVLFTRSAQIISLFVCAGGGVLFFQHSRSGQFTVVPEPSLRGIIALFVLEYAAIAVHEGAHALTCRHYGARVNGAGFLLYMGMPAYFVDTTDIWTKPLRARLATSWAGPYSGLILAGLISILIALFPGLPQAASLHRIASIWVVILIFNLIPFAELDGYYMLVDWLDVPRLRARALGFIRKDLWVKIRRGERFTPLERLFVWFGLASALMTVLLVVLGIFFWQVQLGRLFRALWGAGPVGRLLLIPVVLVIFVPFLVLLVGGLAQQARRGARRLRGWWARPRRTTIRDRLALLNAVSFLSALPREAREEVARRLRPLNVRPGQAVFRQGEEGDAFYLIRRGQAEVVQQRDGVEHVLTTLGPGDHFGEIALLGRAPRTATVRALTSLALLALRRGDFDRLLAPHVTVSENVERAIRENDDLGRLPLLAELPPQERSAVAGRLRRRQYPAGAVIVRQGDVGDTFYIIQSGQAEVLLAADGGERVQRVLGPGAYFGEIALLMDAPRTATVRALTPLVAYTLDRADFETLLGRVLPLIAAEAAARRGEAALEPA